MSVSATSIEPVRRAFVDSVRALIRGVASLNGQVTQVVQSSGLAGLVTDTRAKLQQLHRSMPQAGLEKLDQVFPEGNPFNYIEQLQLSSGGPNSIYERVLADVKTAFNSVNNDMNTLTQNPAMSQTAIISTNPWD